jgi:hypothetical protein
MMELRIAWLLLGLFAGFVSGVTLSRLLWIRVRCLHSLREDVDCCCGHQAHLHVAGPPSVCGVSYCPCVQYVPQYVKREAEVDSAQRDREYDEWLRRAIDHGAN